MNVSIYSGLLAVQNQNQIKCALFLKKTNKKKQKCILVPLVVHHLPVCGVCVPFLSQSLLAEC